jgi:uncharacterized membrane protein YciS (DUF1049 family)
MASTETHITFYVHKGIWILIQHLYLTGFPASNILLCHALALTEKISKVWVTLERRLANPRFPDTSVGPEQKLVQLSNTLRPSDSRLISLASVYIHGFHCLCMVISLLSLSLSLSFTRAHTQAHRHTFRVSYAQLYSSCSSSLPPGLPF